MLGKTKFRIAPQGVSTKGVNAQICSARKKFGARRFVDIMGFFK